MKYRDNSQPFMDLNLEIDPRIKIDGGAKMETKLKFY